MDLRGNFPQPWGACVRSKLAELPKMDTFTPRQSKIYCGSLGTWMPELKKSSRSYLITGANPWISVPFLWKSCEPLTVTEASVALMMSDRSR